MTALTGRHFLLTGATGGIGTALAERLVQTGASVLLQGRDEEKLAKLRTRLCAMSLPPGTEISTSAGDLADRAYVDQLAAEGASAGIDGLINNAGCNEFAAFADTDLEPILSVNVVGTLRLTQALMAHLSTMPGALVVNVGSPFGSIGYPGYVAYCATKHALRGFSEALARENRDTGLTVVYVSPRATRTSMNSPLANAHNAALGVPMDPPEKAADFILKAIERRLPRSQRGLQESVQTWLNSLVPAVVDVALARQLHDIRKHFNSAGG